MRRPYSDVRAAFNIRVVAFFQVAMGSGHVPNLANLKGVVA